MTEEERQEDKSMTEAEKRQADFDDSHRNQMDVMHDIYRKQMDVVHDSHLMKQMRVEDDIGLKLLKTLTDTPEEAEVARKIHQEHVRLERLKEQEKTKRLWLILAVVSMLVALTLIVFAPEGRETLSYWIGAALLVFAAGAATYKRVWFRIPGLSIGADQDKRKL